MENDRRITLEYNFYYYTSDGVFRINARTFLMYGILLCALLVIFSVDYLFQNAMYYELIASTILFIMLVVMLRRLNRD